MNNEDTGESGEAYNVEQIQYNKPTMAKLPIGRNPLGDWDCRICKDIIPFKEIQTIQLHKIYHVLERIERLIREQ